MKHLKRAVHIDFHTMPGVWDVGSDFDAKDFAATLNQAGVEFVNLFARCNHGYTYYPTKVGIPHPGLKKDMLGEAVEECHKHGILVSAYINLGLDNAHAKIHRDWCQINKEARTSTWMCINSPYAEYVCNMIEEIEKLYPIDGYFLDCFLPGICMGEECVSLMRQNGVDPEDEVANRNFYYQTQLEFMRRARKLVGKGKLFFVNGVTFKDQLSVASHLEVECLPVGGWGYDTFPALSRFVRKLDKQVLGMTARFHKSWGDFGGIRPQAALDFDCYNAISNGLQCSIGDHAHPRGTLEKDVYRLIGDSYSKIRSYEPWIDDAVPVTEIAIVSNAYNAVGHDAMGVRQLSGAARVLEELKQQFDVIDTSMDFSSYRLLVLPDAILFDESLVGKIKKHIENGGKIISSGTSGLNEKQTGFALDQWGLSYEGKEDYSVTFFKVGEQIATNIPDIPNSIYVSGIRTRLMGQSEMLAEIVHPYFDDKKEGFHPFTYVPPDKPSGYPAVSRNGNVIHISFPIFRVYAHDAPVFYRDLFKNCLDLLIDDPLILVENLPSFAKVTLTGKEKETMVHILNYCPELRGRHQIIEEPLIATDVSLSVRITGVRQVYLAPDRTPLDFTEESGRTIVHVPVVKGYGMIVFEQN
ncbi:MAG: hypothetical protein GX811_09940 [Lentisphaerae bacterium]|nr:hypothetical protein [Lentisphaerota bacterium]